MFDNEDLVVLPDVSLSSVCSFNMPACNATFILGIAASPSLSLTLFLMCVCVCSVLFCYDTMNSQARTFAYGYITIAEFFLLSY